MKDRKKILNDLITKGGLSSAANLTGLSNLDLIKRSDCYIDTKMANDIIPDLIREKIFPKKYKNCEITFDRMSGVVEWICVWDKETTYSYATPFWDVELGIPVDTTAYMDGLGREFTDNQFTNIKWGEGFDNLALYDRWIRRFYLPQVHNVIQKHLDEYRNDSMV
jgi:hypothetical protein